MHRDTGEWRHGGGISPSDLSRRGATGAEMSFHHRFRSKHILGVQFFARISPNFPEKLFVQLLPAIVLPQRSRRPFFGVTSKKGLHVFFCKPWAPFFEIKQRWVPFLPGFSGILPRFSANQNFWGCSCTPTSNTTAFHNSIIGNFVICQDRLETNLLQLFRYPENSE